MIIFLFSTIAYVPFFLLNMNNKKAWIQALPEGFTPLKRDRVPGVIFFELNKMLFEIYLLI